MSAISSFKKTVDIFPKHSKDLNIVFAVTYAEYKVIVKTVDTLLLLNTILKEQITEMLSALNEEMYDQIMKVLNVVSKFNNKVLPKNLHIDVSVGLVGDLLAVACTDYFGSIPENLYNKFNDFKNAINSIGSLSLGKGLMNTMASELLALKDDLLKSLLGATYSTILLPIIAYENFLKEHGLYTLLKRMDRIERCLTKKGVGNRPVSDFMHTDNNGKQVLNSIYYKNQLLIDSKGNMNIKILNVDSRQKARFNNIMKSTSSFRLTVSS